MREEPLGEDSRGRRYWFFFNDAARLWVEAPKGEVVERDNGSTWAWAFYDTVAHVDMLTDSLNGRGQAGYTCYGYTRYLAMMLDGRSMLAPTACTHRMHPPHAPTRCTHALHRALHRALHHAVGRRARRG